MPSIDKNFIEGIVNKIGKSINDFPTFIETGTYRGDTSGMAMHLFEDVFTIEVDTNLYNGAVNRFKNTNVSVLKGDSIEVLGTLLPSLQSKIIFWLDGHNSGPGTGVGKVDFPILEELIQIDNNLKCDDAILMIDDIRLLGHGHPFEIDDSLKSLTVEKILGSFEKHKIAKHWLEPSSLASEDRLIIYLEKIS